MLAGLDHAAIPVAQMDAMLDFYVHLGCTARIFGRIWLE